MYQSLRFTAVGCLLIAHLGLAPRALGETQAIQTPQLPQLDSIAHCRELQTMARADEASRLRCLKMESVAHKHLFENIELYTPSALARCSRFARLARAGYMSMRFCLMENR